MELPKNKYNIILADPPWEYSDKATSGACNNHYNTLSYDELKKLKVTNISDKDCFLLMWVTFPQMEIAMKLFNDWGFKYKTILFLWIKTTNDGKYHYSIGNYTRSNSEVLLLGRKGKLPILYKNYSQLIFSKRRKHSQKPDVIYTNIERMFGDVKKIELFSRNHREGWDVWGNEIPKEKQKILKTLPRNNNI